MARISDEDEQKIINDMCIDILKILRKNGNCGISALISLLTSSYATLGHDKDKLLKDIGVSWEFYHDTNARQK